MIRRIFSEAQTILLSRGNMQPIGRFPIEIKTLIRYLILVLISIGNPPNIKAGILYNMKFENL